MAEPSCLFWQGDAARLWQRASTKDVVRHNLGEGQRSCRHAFMRGHELLIAVSIFNSSATRGFRQLGAPRLCRFCSGNQHAKFGMVFEAPSKASRWLTSCFALHSLPEIRKGAHP